MATIIDTSTTPSNCGNPSGSNYHHFNMVLSAHIAIKLSASNFILGKDKPIQSLPVWNVSAISIERLLHNLGLLLPLTPLPPIQSYKLWCLVCYRSTSCCISHRLCKWARESWVLLLRHSLPNMEAHWGQICKSISDSFDVPKEL